MTRDAWSGLYEGMDIHLYMYKDCMPDLIHEHEVIVDTPLFKL